jgi:ribosomal protein S18 acetylase RimI-like enzyme
MRGPDFAVASGFSGRGIGTMILKATMEKLRQRGAEAIRMGTIAEDNSVAFAMYSKLGFKFVSTRQFYGDTKVHVMEYRFDSTSQ